MKNFGKKIIGWRLLLSGKKGQTELREIHHVPFTMGRSKNCELSIPFAGISRTHVRIFVNHQNTVFVEDLNSSHGSLFNSKTLSPKTPHLLQVNDVITLGNSGISVCLKKILYDESAPLPSAPTNEKTATPENSFQDNYAVELNRDLSLPDSPEKVSSRTKVNIKIEDLRIANAQFKKKKELADLNLQIKALKITLEQTRKQTHLEIDSLKLEQENILQKVLLERSSAEKILQKVRSIESILESKEKDLEAVKSEEKKVRLEIDLIKEQADKHLQESKDQSSLTLEELNENQKMLAHKQSEILNLEKQFLELEFKNSNKRESFESESAELDRKILQTLEKLKTLEDQWVSKNADFEKFQADGQLNLARLQTSIESKNLELLQIQKKLYQLNLEEDASKDRLRTQSSELESLKSQTTDLSLQLKDSYKNLETLGSVKTDLLKNIDELKYQVTEQENLLSQACARFKNDSLSFDQQRLEKQDRLLELNQKTEDLRTLQAKEIQAHSEVLKNQQLEFSNLEKQFHLKLAGEQKQHDLRLIEEIKTAKSDATLEARAKLDKEIKIARSKLDEQLNEHKSQFEAQLRAKEIEALKKQKDFEEARSETLIQGTLAALRESLSDGKVEERSQILDLQEARLRALLKSLSMANDEASLRSMSQNPLWLKVGPSKNSFLKVLRPFAPAASLASAGILAFVAYSSFQKLPQWIAKQEMTSRKDFNARIAQSRAEQEQKFSPLQDEVFRESFTDNLLYVSGYAQMRNNESIMNKWIIHVNEFFTKEIPGGDRKAPQYLATESALIKQLIESQASVFAKNPLPGIDRMRMIEKAYLDKLYDSAGTKKQFLRIREIERKFYESNKANLLSEDTMRTPASEN